MAFEKTLLAVPAQSLLQNGSQYGQVRIPSTTGFKLRQKVKLVSDIISKDLEVKAVLDETNILLGPVSASLSDFEDLRAFTVLDNSQIFAESQNRQAIPPDGFWRSVFEESPTVAIRTFSVDWLGRPFSTDNPIPVQLSNGSVNIGTVNAQLETFLTHKDNDPDQGDVHSSVRIGDGKDELSINDDGSLNVVVQADGSTPKPTISIFNEITAVPYNDETPIVIYQVLPSQRMCLDRISASGENIAKYKLYKNGELIDVKRTYYSGDINVMFEFSSKGEGYVLEEGDLIELKVINNNIDLDSGDFEARIQMVKLN